MKKLLITTILCVSGIASASNYKCIGFCYEGTHPHTYLGIVESEGKDAFKSIMTKCENIASEKDSKNFLVTSAKLPITYSTHFIQQSMRSLSANFNDTCKKL